MEAVLLALEKQAKNAELKEAVGAAKEALKNLVEKKDAPLAYVREKCLGAIELAFDHGNEKAQHSAVEGVQCLLRDRRFHSDESGRAEHALPTQILHTFTGVSQWGPQLQCHAMTLIVELMSSTELTPTLMEVQESIELCMRVFGGSREEAPRMSARAAVSQSIASYCSNRYCAVDDPQDFIAVYLDATSLLEGYVQLLEQMKTSNEQSVVVLDATHALLSAQPLSILQHTPFLNLLWEKVCPLLIRLLGVPDRAAATPAPVSLSGSESTDEQPVGQGQMARFALSPAVLANPEASRALYLIVDQLLRLLSAAPSMHSVLEALFHKAFLFPKIEQRTEAIKVIRKLLADPRRLSDLVSISLSAKSLSLWRMLIVCLVESSSPSFDVCIEAIRATHAMLQGLLEFISTDGLLPPEAKSSLLALFPTLEDATAQSFALPVRRSTTLESRESRDSVGGNEADEEGDEDYADTLRKLEKKFGILKEEEDEKGGERGKEEEEEPPPTPSASDPTSEKATARRFVSSLLERLGDWSQLRSTVLVDTAILGFAASYQQDFSSAHTEKFRATSKVQQEFLNTDALYLAAYACLSLGIRGEHVVTWGHFKSRVLVPGCHVYATETWLSEVYLTALASPELKQLASQEGAMIEAVRDYDGFDHRMLSDHLRLQKIRDGPGEDSKHFPEKLASRWLMTASWEGVSKLLSTFVSVKERRRARPKVQEAVVHAIRATRSLANVALALGLGSRCGWIFERLVESSCDVDELRKTATAEEAKRIGLVDRDDLLSIQLVLDHAFVAIHAPECWKHVIRCTEYVWELEKYIYGALCYQEKATASRFTLWRKEKTPEPPREEGTAVADRDVETALAEGRAQPERDELNRAICILIAKTDRFYTTCGGCLSLPSLHALLLALVAASENRVLLSPMASPSLTPADSLIGRLSLILSHLPNRPLVHQMLLWSTVSGHLVQVASSSVDESRSAAAVLTETVASLILSEQPGQAFNQMLLAPFQTIMCREDCLPETRTQLILALSESVKERSDKLGSGWKPLFGSLRAVRTLQLDEDRVPWTVLDVIGTYLGLTKCNVISSSLPDCLACVTHFLQSTVLPGTGAAVVKEAMPPPESPSILVEEKAPETSSEDLDTQLSEAALKLIRPLYAVILNLYRTPHAPNPSLLHKLDLRTRALAAKEGGAEEDEGAASSRLSVSPLSSVVDSIVSARLPEDVPASTMDRPLYVPVGELPWSSDDAQAYQMASCELLLSLVEQLCGALVTAPPSVQPTMIETISFLVTSIRSSPFGSSLSAYSIHALLLPHISMWTRRVGGAARKDRAQATNHRHAVGTATAVVVDSIEACPDGLWETKLLADALDVARVCAEQSGEISRVGVAAIRHLLTLAPVFGDAQWRVVARGFWDAWSVTLRPLRVLLSHYLPETVDETADVGELFTDGKGVLAGRARILAKQVFLVDIQREELSPEDSSPSIGGDDEESVDESSVRIIAVQDGVKEIIIVADLVRSLLAHQLLLQQLGALLTPEGGPPEGLRRLVHSHGQGHLERIGTEARASLLHCLEASLQTSLALDARHGLCSLLSRLLDVPNANLHKQAVAAVAIKMHALFTLAEAEAARDPSATENKPLWRMSRSQEALISELKRVEQATAHDKITALVREHREQKFEFMLVDDGSGETLYKLVGEKAITSTIAEYKSHRPLGIPGAKSPVPPSSSPTPPAPNGRVNPFINAVVKTAEAPKQNSEPLSAASLRLGALRECCSVVADRLLSSSLFPLLLPSLAPHMAELLLATPDLAVRKMYVKYTQKLIEEQRD